MTPLTPAQTHTLVTASDTSSLTHFADARERIAVIRATFTSTRDHRGIFPIFYSNIIEQAIPALASPQLHDRVWAERVSRIFVAEYLDNLHGELTGGPVSKYWQNYFRTAADCTRSVGRVATAALAAHLAIDLPVSIDKSRATPTNADDFFLLGEGLVKASPGIARDVKAIYGQDLTDLFHLFWFGTTVDSLAGTPLTVTSFFQGARFNAWLDGLALRNKATRPTALAGMNSKYYVGSSGLDTMERLGLI